MRGIHRVNSPYKWPVTRKKFPFDDVIMLRSIFTVRLPSAFCRLTLSNSISFIKILVIDYNIGSDGWCLVLNRRQAIIWTNDSLSYRHDGWCLSVYLRWWTTCWNFWMAKLPEPIGTTFSLQWPHERDGYQITGPVVCSTASASLPWPEMETTETGGFPSQRASNAGNVSIWWRRDVFGH